MHCEPSTSSGITGGSSNSIPPENTFGPDWKPKGVNYDYLASDEDDELDSVDYPVQSIPPERYEPIRYEDYKPPEPAPYRESTTLANNWVYPRGRELIADEGRREDFFTRNETMFWQSVSEIFEGADHSMLSTDVITRLKTKWRNSYAAFKRRQARRNRPEDVFNMNLEHMSLDQLFDKLDEVEDPDRYEIPDEPDFIRSALDPGEEMPLYRICPEGMRLCAEEELDETREEFINLLKQRNAAYKRKLDIKKENNY